MVEKCSGKSAQQNDNQFNRKNGGWTTKNRGGCCGLWGIHEKKEAIIRPPTNDKGGRCCAGDLQRGNKNKNPAHIEKLWRQ